ncbi:hypothetical protein Bpfe_025533, partial [Biomphalaria pfeifferi]
QDFRYTSSFILHHLVQVCIHNDSSYWAIFSRCDRSIFHFYKMSSFNFSFVLGLLMLTTPGCSRRPYPQTCREFGFQLYRYKNVQMCLLFVELNKEDSRDSFYNAMLKCKGFGAYRGVFNTKEKLGILQEQTRCGWVGFRYDSYKRKFIWGIDDGEYIEAKHKELFYGEYPYFRLINGSLVALRTCGVYVPEKRLLEMDLCQPEYNNQDCRFHAICEMPQFTREDL